MRRPLIAGNWKMHKTLPEATQLAMALKSALVDVNDRDIMVAPSAPLLHAVSEKLKFSPIKVAAQNMHEKAEGAFTGANSGPMLKSVGCAMVILGHSERRHVFGETDKMINAKVRAALGYSIQPILCVGETLEAREAGRTFEVVGAQLKKGLEGVSNEHATQVVIAYEPVWAIGTGKTASPEQAQAVHAFIRTQLGEMFRSYVPSNVRVLYGGSVKPGNVDALMAQPDIDGALVGGASLNSESFARIVKFEAI